MSNKYKVRTHSWVNGILNTKDHQFDDRDQAINFAQRTGADHSKVLDKDDRVIYHQKNYQKEIAPKKVKVKTKHQDTYAG